MLAHILGQGVFSLGNLEIQSFLAELITATMKAEISQSVTTNMPNFCFTGRREQICPVRANEEPSLFTVMSWISYGHSHLRNIG